MSRAVTADHVLFDECIEAFRRAEGRSAPGIRPDARSCSKILLSFELTEQWELPSCTVYPTDRVILPGANSAFISNVDNPEWCGLHNSHLFAVGLSAVVSFATGRLCKSSRDDYLCKKELTKDELHELALLFPVLTAGPGHVTTSLSQDTIRTQQEAVRKLIEQLYSLPYRTYVASMQAIRLVQLSLSAKRDDFGLAYLLIVSAIESIAQLAIKREKVRRKHKDEATWKRRAKDDPEFSEVLRHYLDARGKNQYLTERYIRFINTFAPFEKWEEAVDHPLRDIADYVQEVSPGHDMELVLKKRWFERYPTDLGAEEIDKILSDSYTHRSCFIHRGEQPPHREPTPSGRFFQVLRNYDGSSVIEELLPNYELLVGIARRSIAAWITQET